MASLAASSVLLLLLAAFATSANAATFTITNQCPYTVWPAAIPVGGGVQLNQGQPWTIVVPAGNHGRIWGRTGCNFNNGGCQTGDCAGALNCSVSGQPATLAEFSIGGSTDFYDISLVDGYNVPMDFGCSTGATLRCRDASCPDAYQYHQPNDPMKTHSCSGNSNYQVVFCP